MYSPQIFTVNIST